MFGKTLEQHLREIITQGNNAEYKRLFHKIVRIHRNAFTEENLPTAEDFILECVNEALDDMWTNEKCKREMGVYKSFIPSRDAIIEEERLKIEANERHELARLKQKYEPTTIQSEQ